MTEQKNNITSSKKRGQIRLELDPEKSPEAIAFFTDHENDEFSSYELAAALVQCDKTADMPRVLFDFIADLYHVIRVTKRNNVAITTYFPAKSVYNCIDKNIKRKDQI